MKMLALIVSACLLVGCSGPTARLCCDEPLLCDSASSARFVRMSQIASDPKMLNEMRAANRIVPGKSGEVVSVIDAKSSEAVVKVRIVRTGKDAWVIGSCVCDK